MYIRSFCVRFSTGGCLFGQGQLLMEFITFLSVQNEKPNFVYSGG